MEIDYGRRVRAIALALKGAFIELCQLLLVFAGATLGAGFFAGPSRFAARVDVASLLQLLGFFAVFSLFVLYPARDLVQGWLGMIAGRRPERYAERGENVGRAVVALASMALLMLPSAHAEDSHEVKAFSFAFLGLALFVFGLGSAVPRLWFAIRTGGGGRPAEVPALLGVAGTRAAVFVYCAFMGIGIGLATASIARAQRPELAAAVSTWPREQLVGKLCRVPTAACPTVAHGEVTAPVAARIAISAIFYRDPPLCEITPIGWPATTAERAALAARLVDSDPPQQPYVASVAEGDRISLTIAVPVTGPDTCTYFIDLADAEAPR